MYFVLYIQIKIVPKLSTLKIKFTWKTNFNNREIKQKCTYLRIVEVFAFTLRTLNLNPTNEYVYVDFTAY